MPIPGIEELVIYQKYFNRDFAEMLRKFLPRGYVWRIPLPREDDIRARSILSAESFGLLTIPPFLGVITPNGIPSGENVGTPLAIGFGLFMTGIPSGESFGSASIDQTFTVVGIPSEEAVGTPTVHMGMEIMGIASAEVVPAPSSAIRQYIAASSFESSLNPSEWNTEFPTDFYQTTESGEGIAQSATDVSPKLFPKSTDLLTGDFTILFGLWASATEPGTNHSCGLRIYDSVPAMKVDVWYGEGEIKEDITDAIEAVATGPIEHPMKIERVSGVIWVYIWTGSSWLRMDAWDTPKSSISFSGDCYITANGAEAQNGFTYIQIIGQLA